MDKTTEGTTNEKRRDRCSESSQKMVPVEEQEAQKQSDLEAKFRRLRTQFPPPSSSTHKNQVDIEDGEECSFNAQPILPLLDNVHTARVILLETTDQSCKFYPAESHSMETLVKGKLQLPPCSYSIERFLNDKTKLEDDMHTEEAESSAMNAEQAPGMRTVRLRDDYSSKEEDGKRKAHDGRRRTWS